MRSEQQLLSAKEAAYVTRVPLKTVRWILREDLLCNFAEKHKGKWMISKCALVGLKLAYETAGTLTLEDRRRLVRHVLEYPVTETVREDAVSFDVCSMKNDVKQRLASLDKAKRIIVSKRDILAGAPCFKGTRIPAHVIAAMRANGEQVASIIDAYPSLTEEQVDAATIYDMAYPRRNSWQRRPAWWETKLRTTKKGKLDTLLQGS